MAQVAPVALATRIVEVIADHGVSARPRYRYGSGCIVAGRTVLTAAHVVAGAVSVQVRNPDKVARTATVDARFVGDVDGLAPDLALVELENLAVDLAAMPLAVVDRDSADAAPVERCHAVGYPWFAERPSPTAVRDTADAYGLVAVLSKLASGLLSLQVSSGPRPLPPEDVALGESEWSGMSGAPVFAAGCLLGVVTEHAPREGPSTITFVPLSALQADGAHPGWGPGVRDPAAWWARLGARDSAVIRRLPGREHRERPEPAYRSTVREIHGRTGLLRGRAGELSRIAAFATGSQPYRWLTGGAWAGKTALLAAAVVAALPAEVDVIAYFLSRREGDADANRFLAAVVPQLADVLGEDPGTIDAHQFRALWQRACDAASADARHLLLVVDGLDEDLRPVGLPSVAALLPTLAGGRAHVLVSSRPHPELPTDVPGGHPLLATRPVELEAFAGSVQRAALARQEIDDLKRRDDDGVATDVFATLTAAAGPLAVSDIATLTSGSLPVAPMHTRRVRRLLTQAAARSLQPVGPQIDRRYQFAHLSLLEYARQDDDLSDPAYRQRIHGWAQEWHLAGWPAPTMPGSGVPRYLLDVYATTLAGEGDPVDHERLAELVTDIGWIDSALCRIGLDRVLASLRTATQLTPTKAGVTAMLRLVQLEAERLRPPLPVTQPGYALTALAWGALRSQTNDVACAAAERLRRYGAPQLIPSWISQHTQPHLVSAVGRDDDWVWAIAVTPDGQVVSGGDDGAVRLWDPRAPNDPSREVGRHDDAVWAIAVTPDGQIVSSGGDGRVRLWEPRAPNDHGREVARGDGWVLAIAVTADRQIVCGDQDGTVRLWDPRTPNDSGREVGRHEDSIGAIAVTADRQIVSGAQDGTVRLWDPRAERSRP